MVAWRALTLGEVEAGTCKSAADVVITLAASKQVIGRLQELVITRQLRRLCEAARLCPVCQAERSIKDYRRRRLDTILGRVVVKGPRFNRLPPLRTAELVVTAHPNRYGRKGAGRGLTGKQGRGRLLGD